MDEIIRGILGRYSRRIPGEISGGFPGQISGGILKIIILGILGRTHVGIQTGIFEKRQSERILVGSYAVNSKDFLGFTKKIETFSGKISLGLFLEEFGEKFLVRYLREFWQNS